MARLIVLERSIAIAGTCTRLTHMPLRPVTRWVPCWPALPMATTDSEHRMARRGRTVAAATADVTELKTALAMELIAVTTALMFVPWVSMALTNEMSPSVATTPSEEELNIHRKLIRLWRSWWVNLIRKSWRSLLRNSLLLLPRPHWYN